MHTNVDIVHNQINSDTRTTVVRNHKRAGLYVSLACIQVRANTHVNLVLSEIEIYGNLFRTQVNADTCLSVVRNQMHAYTYVYVSLVRHQLNPNTYAILVLNISPNFTNLKKRYLNRSNP